MNSPELHVGLSADHLQGVLRADQIRRDTLTQLVQMWAEPGVREEVIAALDHLAEVVQSPREEGELEAAVEAVDDAACMEYPQLHMGREATRRLHRDVSGVVAAWDGSRPVAVREQQSGRDAA